jgi:hypothetical protein
MADPDDYADRDLPRPRFPPFRALLLIVGLVIVGWCCVPGCALWVWLLSRVGPLGPDN